MRLQWTRKRSAARSSASSCSLKAGTCTCAAGHRAAALKALEKLIEEGATFQPGYSSYSFSEACRAALREWKGKSNV